jgi:hypothetical protein
MHKILLTAAVLLGGAIASTPISADQDPSLFHLRSIAERSDVVAALNRFDAAPAAQTYGSGWEQDMLSLQYKMQAEVFGTR